MDEKFTWCVRCSRMLPSIRVLNDFEAGGRGILLRQTYLRHHVDLILRASRKERAHVISGVLGAGAAMINIGR